jgi:arsenate reductase (thioredoxin)
MDESPNSASRPMVVFLCVHNAGRSQMAMGWFNHLAGGAAEARSGGSEPAAALNPMAVVAMAEVGIDISATKPRPWTTDVLAQARMVITMGCGDTCPVLPAVTYQDWPLEDPAGRPLAEVRVIRDQIEQRVRALLRSLGVTGEG